MKIHVTPFAVKTPDVPTPRTADMFDLVEAHRRAGLYPRPVPACFQLPNGSLMAHPDIATALRRKIKAVEHELEWNALYGARVI